MAADDIVQEALLAAYKKWDEVSRLDYPGAWPALDISVVRRKDVAFLDTFVGPKR